MKKFFYLFVVLALIICCKNTNEKSFEVQNPNSLQPKDASKKYPEMQFDTMQWNFGSIREGATVSHDFHFKNVGNGVLVIQDVHPSCGCTSPSWPKEPIAPGETAVITVKFNSTGKTGKQGKTVTIISNPCTIKNSDKISNETNLGIHAEVH